MKNQPSGRLLTRKSRVCEELGLTPSGLSQLHKKYPDFPRPIKFGDSRQAPVYYDAGEIRAWIETRKAERGAA